MALQQHIVTTDLSLTLTVGSKNGNDTESRIEQLRISTQAIENKYLEAAKSSPASDHGSVSEFDSNNDLHEGIGLEFTGMNINATTSLELEGAAETFNHNSNVPIVDESGLRAAGARSSGLPWWTDGRAEVLKPLSGGELPMKETINFYINNDSNGGLVNVSISELERGVDMASDIKNSKVPTVDESTELRLSCSITERDSWHPWSTSSGKDAKPGSCVLPLKKLDAETIAVRDKPSEGVNHNNQEYTRDGCQVYLEDHRGLKHFSLHELAALPNLPPVEEEICHVKNCQSPKEPVLYTSHVTKTFLLNKNVLQGHLLSKKRGSFDGNEAENLSGVQKKQYAEARTLHFFGASDKQKSPSDSKISLGSASGFTPVITRDTESISLSSPHVVSGAPAVVHPRHIPFNSPGNTCAQLILSYAGTVSVYNNIPADKAHAIMNFAGIGNCLSGSAQRSPSMHVLKANNAMSSSFNRDAVQPAENKQQELSNVLSPCQPVVPKALPVARKASLARFLEKRKERMQSIAPYLAKDCCQDLLLHEGRKFPNANPGAVFYNETSGSHVEGKLGSKDKLLDDGTIRLQNAAFHEMDVEDQNWLNTAQNAEQILEA